MEDLRPYAEKPAVSSPTLCCLLLPSQLALWTTVQVIPLSEVYVTLRKTWLDVWTAPIPLFLLMLLLKWHFTRRIWAVYFLSWTSVCLVSYSGRGCTAVWALVLPWSVWLNGSSGGSPDPSLIAGIMVSCVMIYAVSTLKEMLLQYLRYLWKSNTEWWVIL